MTITSWSTKTFLNGFKSKWFNGSDELKNKFFNLDKKPHDKKDIFTYKEKTGELFYDANGKKGGFDKDGLIVHCRSAHPDRGERSHDPRLGGGWGGHRLWSPDRRTWFDCTNEAASGPRRGFCFRDVGK